MIIFEHMKERKQRPTPADPRGAAKDFIRQPVRAGATLEDLLHRQPSSWDDRDSATVGGTIWNRREGQNEYLPLAIDKVAGARVPLLKKVASTHRCAHPPG